MQQTVPQRRIAIFIPSFGDGGVEHMLVNTARGLAACGVAVDFIVDCADRPYLSALAGRCRLIELRTGKAAGRLTGLLAYLREERPDIVVSAKGPDDRLAVKAKRRCRGHTRFFLRPGTTISARNANRRRNPIRAWLKLYGVRRLYQCVDGVVTVSNGVADDIARITRLPRERIRVVRNPVVTPELEQASQAPLDHPWFAPGEPPVILGIGGLRTQKDFPTLLKAFAQLRAARPARLLILGEGRQRERLLEQADHLGIADDFALPGFVANPYPYLRRAALFVLSSLWEGSPNVLSEALAVGTPAVATDCPSGPREVLQNGRYGPLVPMGDPKALAVAMAATLETPLPDKVLREAVADYTMEKSARGYLQAFGLLPEDN